MLVTFLSQITTCIIIIIIFFLSYYGVRELHGDNGNTAVLKMNRKGLN